MLVLHTKTTISANAVIGKGEEFLVFVFSSWPVSTDVMTRGILY